MDVGHPSDGPGNWEVDSLTHVAKESETPGKVSPRWFETLFGESMTVAGPVNWLSSEEEQSK
jgi:hypothetical protein